METKRIRWNASYTDWLTYAAIAAGLLAVLMAFAGKKSFFSDEMDQIGILVSVRTLPELLRLYASVGHEVAPPLFAALAWVWYRIVPYGQAWLQLLPALLTCLGVYVVGLSGRACGGRRMGVLAALFALASPAVALTAGMQLRQYCVLFLCSALTTYLYVLRNNARKAEKWSVLVLYGVAMAGLPYTHYVSVLLPVAFFLLDVVLLFAGRIRARCLWSYAIGGGLFLPWGLSILRSVASRSEFWIDKPRLADLPEALRFLTDGGGALYHLFLLGCCIALAVFIRACLTRTPLERANAFPFMLACVPYFVIGCVFVYSAYLSEQISLFLPRYFICVIPVILLTAAYAAERLFALLLHGHARTAAATATLSLCLFVAAAAGLRVAKTVREDVGTVYEPYREAADWLSERADIHDGNVAVVTSNLSAYVTKGWEAYYVTRGGQRASFPIFDYARAFTEAEAATYDVVYAFVEHAALPERTQALLNACYRPDPGCMDGMQWRVTRYVLASDG